MRRTASDYTVSEKLRILEKEWLPLVIERASERIKEEQDIKEAFCNYSKLGVLVHLPIKIQEPIDMDITFEKYLDYREDILLIRRSDWRSICQLRLDSYTFIKTNEI